MKLNYIDIVNFRGFQDEHFDLDPRMNVIVGNNTAGKTTILQAIQIALGAYLQSLTIIPTDRSYRRNFAMTDRPMYYNESKNDFFPVEGNPTVTVEAPLRGNGMALIVNKNLKCTWVQSLKLAQYMFFSKANHPKSQ